MTEEQYKQRHSIRFRAKDIRTGEWVEGYYALQHQAIFDDFGIHEFKEEHAIFNDEPGNREFGGYWTTINPATLGQMTGIKDTDDNDIWEGDIVYDPLMTAGNYMVVVWWKKYGAMKCYHPVHGIIPIQGDAVEVVGNIYEDTDLLDGEYEPHEIKLMLDIFKP